MRLHLGCGKRHIPGWFHIDAVAFPHIDLLSAIDHIPQAADGSASIIYSAHTLEHFPRQRTPEVLREWRRILRHGGILRVAVPDFDALARLYLDTGDMALIHGPVWGGGGALYDVHHTGFSERTLKAALIEAGFDDPHRYDWRTTEHADVDDFSQAYYPKMAHYPGGVLVERASAVKGILLSLNMEATKP